MRVMILAAGRGNRLRPLTDTVPKPLIEVQGRTLIEHHLYRLAADGFTEVVINVAWLADKIKQRLGDGSRYGVHIDYSEERQGALETGGGILKALPLLGKGPFLTLNADVYTNFAFASLKAVLKPGDCAHLVMVPNPSHHPQGDFRLSEDGRLHTDGEPRLTYSGIGVHHPEFFKDCAPGRFPMLPLWQQAIRADHVSGQHYTGRWHDVSTPDGLPATMDSD